MICAWRKDSQTRTPTVVAFLPPAMIEETGWDILLALHSDRRQGLSLEKLASLASVSEAVMSRWLAGLEQHKLIAGAMDSLTGELRAALTRAGRELLDRYLSAACDLQLGTSH